MDKDKDIWSTTRRHDRVPGLPGIQIISGVIDYFMGRRQISARISVSADACEGVRFDFSAAMTAMQMRGLAALLTDHADRIEHELMPLLAPEATSVPSALYREPESA